MNIKQYDFRKINIKQNKILLFYGKNDGLKHHTKLELIKKRKNVSNYDQSDILNNNEILFENLYSQGLFDNERTIIIKRTNDKILKVIEKIEPKKLDDTLIIVDADNLEKKSKLRTYFEKHKNFICIAFYEENEQTLVKVAQNFLRQKNIILSSSSINLVVNKCNGDRGNLLKELEKIENYSKNKKIIKEEDISKLTNLIEDHDISKLIDHCLVKNTKKTIKILNENNFQNEDCLLIIRIFLNKAKRILNLSNEYEKNKDINKVISSARPPIFWKDKEITIQQIYKWNPKDMKMLIYKLSELELIVKKNINNSINLTVNFILDQLFSKQN